MRSKSILTLIEELIMLLVFALAAALCLQAFVWAGNRSAQNERRDEAVIAAQSAAETIRHFGGDPSAALERAAEQLGGSWNTELLQLNYDEDWNVVAPEAAVYHLLAQSEESGLPGLEKAVLWVFQGSGSLDPLFTLEIAWQGEVGTDE